MPQIVVRIPEDMAAWLEQKCPARGDASRYVRQLLTAEQMKEATAPLVPDGSSFADWNSPEDAAYDDPPPPKSLIEALTESVEQTKAKRNARKVPDQPVSVKNRGGRIMKTQEPSSKSVKGSPAVSGLRDAEERPADQGKQLRAESPSRGRPKRRKQLEPSGGPPPVGATVPLPASGWKQPRKPKTCQHSNTIRKLGMPFCEDCGEFV